MFTKVFNRLVLIVLLALTPTALLASAAPVHPVSPTEGLEMLRKGNMRFALGQSVHPNTSFSRRLLTTTDGQAPFATVIGCSDSRVPVEILFDQGIGDLFVIKVAGNVADTDEIGSAEYGVEHLGTPVLMVLGHTYCGAVTAVATGAEVHGSIPQLVDNIIPAVERAKLALPDADTSDLVARATEENIWQGIEDILTKSHGIAERAAHGQVVIVGAVYNILTGRVDILGTHPAQADLLKGAADAITYPAPEETAVAAVEPAQAAPPAEDVQETVPVEDAAQIDQPAEAEHQENAVATHEANQAAEQPVSTVAAEKTHTAQPAAAHHEEQSSSRFGFFSFIIFLLLLIGTIYMLDTKILNPNADKD